jgi:fructokinase
VGADGLGDFLADTLTDEGIAGDLLVRDDDAPTGLAVVSADADGDRGFVLYLDGTASTRLQPGRVADDRLAATDWLHLGGVELAHEPARSAVLDLLARAPPDTTVSLDPNARPQLWTEFDYADTLARVLPDVDVLVASVEDLRPAGYDGDPAAVAARLVDDGPHTALLTRGADGAVGHATQAAPWGAAETAHAGFSVDVVDTTGAGDAFTAGVVHALGDGRSLAAAVRFADAVAARSTTARGAMAALPDRAAVARLLE